MTFKTDKVTHGFLPAYMEIAASIGTCGVVCELGVYDGGSLEMWQAFFPDGIVIGIDQFDHSIWPEGTIEIVSDQANDDLPYRLGRISENGYDLIVDDCSHKGGPTRRSWELLWPLVKPGGWYVIEDWFVGLPPWTDPARQDLALNGDVEMLRTAESFLQLFKTLEEGDSRAGRPDSVTYRYGLIILRKSR